MSTPGLPAAAGLSALLRSLTLPIRHLATSVPWPPRALSPCRPSPAPQASPQASPTLQMMNSAPLDTLLHRRPHAVPPTYVLTSGTDAVNTKARGRGSTRGKPTRPAQPAKPTPQFRRRPVIKSRPKTKARPATRPQFRPCSSVSDLGVGMTPAYHKLPVTAKKDCCMKHQTSAFRPQPAARRSNSNMALSPSQTLPWRGADTFSAWLRGEQSTDVPSDWSGIQGPTKTDEAEDGLRLLPLVRRLLALLVRLGDPGDAATPRVNVNVNPATH